jgi:BirA family biotin operon repressor/biotin-[acetyl-CoA-carboxylase] ligase
MPDPVHGAALDGCILRFASHIRVEVLDQCTSTNALLLERARSGEPHATAIVCEKQTAGRGRQGNAWISVPGSCLTFSLLWRFDSRLPVPASLGLAVGVALVEALESLGAQGIQLKWPNDLLLEERKLGGILIEAFQEKDKTVAVIGVGLNVSNSESIRVRAGCEVADLREAGVQDGRTDILMALLEFLGRGLDSFEAAGFAPVREAWLNRDAWQGRRLRLCNSQGVVAEGVAAGVGEDGALLLQSEGLIRAYYSGELSLRQA